MQKVVNWLSLDHYHINKNNATFTIKCRQLHSTEGIHLRYSLKNYAKKYCFTMCKDHYIS